jgi:hypothetical protein
MDPDWMLDENESPKFGVIVREYNLIIDRVVPEEGVTTGDTDVCNPHV